MDIKNICKTKATEIIRARRDSAIENEAIRRTEIFRKYPEIEDLTFKIENEMSSLISVMISPKKTSKEFEAKKATINDLKKKRDQILSSHGLKEEDLHIKYYCEKCSDTGAIGTELCSCYKKVLSEQYLAISNLSTEKATRTLNDFNIDFYPEKNKAYIRDMVDFARGYIDDFETQKTNILFTGISGCGKTMLSCAMGYELIQKGYFVIYSPVQEMINNYSDYQFGKNDQIDISIYTDCDLLIIDDLGSEFKTQFSENIIYNIINTRINNNSPFIISTNLMFKKDFEANYHSRVVSRLLNETMNLKFPAVDIREILHKTK